MVLQGVTHCGMVATCSAPSSAPVQRAVQSVGHCCICLLMVWRLQPFPKPQSTSSQLHWPWPTVTTGIVQHAAPERMPD